MSLTFSFRANTTSAYYAPGGELSGYYDQGQTTLAKIVDCTLTGCIGSKALDLNSSSFNSWRNFSGIGNTPLTQAITVVYRLARSSAGTATSVDSFFQLGGDTASYYSVLAFQQQVGNNIVALKRNEIGQTDLTSVTVGSYNFADTSFHDFVVSWAGTTTALLYTYFDGVTLGATTVIRSINVDQSIYSYNTISLGRYLTSNVSTHYCNEMLIFNEALSAASITATFTGPTRAAFYSATVSQPVNSTDPGSSNVASGVPYTFKGLSLTGSFGGVYTDPGIANVLSGTSYIFNSATLTGTYHDATYTDPGIGNYDEGFSYPNISKLIKTGLYIHVLML